MPTSAQLDGSAVMTSEHMANSGILDLDTDASVPSRTFLETKRFSAVVSLGQISKGHTLICPLQVDALSVAAASIHDVVNGCQTLPAFLECVRLVSTVLRRAFSGCDLVYFEHGVSSRDSGSRCGTCFPHFHIVPVLPKVASQFVDRVGLSASLYAETTRSYSSLSSFYLSRRRSGEYLFASNGASEYLGIWSGRERRFPGELLRTSVQMLIGQQPTSWKSNPNISASQSCAVELRAFAEALGQ